MRYWAKSSIVLFGVWSSGCSREVASGPNVDGLSPPIQAVTQGRERAAAIDEPRFKIDLNMATGRSSFGRGETIGFEGAVECPADWNLEGEPIVLEGGFYRAQRMVVTSTTVARIRRDPEGSYSFRAIMEGDRLPDKAGAYVARASYAGEQAPTIKSKQRGKGGEGVHSNILDFKVGP